MGTYTDGNIWKFNDDGPNCPCEGENMKDLPDATHDECICADIPTALYDRVSDYCRSSGITPREFIIDAISEKLLSIHRERRRKPRL